jgi:hypothetical protein
MADFENIMIADWLICKTPASLVDRRRNVTLEGKNGLILKTNYTLTYIFGKKDAEVDIDSICNNN